jgi:hypothetical protein
MRPTLWTMFGCQNVYACYGVSKLAGRWSALTGEPDRQLFAPFAKFFFAPSPVPHTIGTPHTHAHTHAHKRTHMHTHARTRTVEPVCCVALYGRKAPFWAPYPPPPLSPPPLDAAGGWGAGRASQEFLYWVWSGCSGTKRMQKVCMCSLIKLLNV